MEASEAGRALAKLGASKGGKASAKNLSKKELSKRASGAATARWAKRRKKAC